MKTLITLLATAAALIAAITLCGFSVDAIVVLACGFAAGIASLFVHDYSRKFDYRLESFKAPVVIRTRRVSAPRLAENSSVFASLIVFNTTIA